MSAVLKTEEFETIYDHHVTDDEILAMNDGYPETRDEYFEALGHDSAMAGLYHLYKLRGQPDKAAYYLDQIHDIPFRNQFKIRPCCVHS